MTRRIKAVAQYVPLLLGLFILVRDREYRERVAFAERAIEVDKDLDVCGWEVEKEEVECV